MSHLELLSVAVAHATDYERQLYELLIEDLLQQLVARQQRRNEKLMEEAYRVAERRVAHMQPRLARRGHKFVKRYGPGRN